MYAASLKKIVLSPKSGEDDLKIDLYGNLAGILKIASEDNPLGHRDNIRKRLESLSANDNQRFERSAHIGSGGRI